MALIMPKLNDQANKGDFFYHSLCGQVVFEITDTIKRDEIVTAKNIKSLYDGQHMVTGTIISCWKCGRTDGDFVCISFQPKTFEVK